MPLFTVIVPTFDHQDTLYASVASVLAQTVDDLEVVVIGDGAPPRTDAIMAEFCACDSRVVYARQPKGPRHGEIYRDTVIRESVATYVAYLGDDDLWFPKHLETLLPHLRENDFAHTLHTDVFPDNSVSGLLFNVGSPQHRREIAQRSLNGFGLSFGAHRKSAYERLPKGWATTPEKTPTDIFMWSKFAEQQSVTMASVLIPTAVHFAAPQRKGWSPLQRLAELNEWARQISEPSFTKRLMDDTSYVVAFDNRWVRPDSGQSSDFDTLLMSHNARVRVVQADEMPNNVEAGCAYLNAHQLESLEACFDSARSSPESILNRWRPLFDACPQSWANRLICGRYLNGSGRAEECRIALEPVVDAEQSIADVLTTFALALRKLGEVSTALELVGGGLKREPTHYGLSCVRAQLLLDLGSGDDVAALLMPAIESEPGRPWAIRLLAKSLFALQRFQEAAPIYQRLIELTPDQSQPAVKLGVCQFELGEFDASIATLTRAAELAPPSPAVYLYSARAMVELDRLVKAKAFASDGLDRFPAHRGLQKFARKLNAQRASR